VTGTSDSNGAVSVAHALEGRYQATVQAVQVLDTSAGPMPAPLPSMFTIARDLIGDAPYAADVLARQREFAALLGQPNEWPVRISLGTPAEEILRHARQVDATLITMGLRRHGIVDRVLRDEATLTVARRATVPVLGVVPGLRGLPRNAVVGVDFGPTSIAAAFAALDVLARPASPESPVALQLVYVDRYRDENARNETTGEALIARLGVRAAFEQLMTALAPPTHVRVDATTLHGRPGQELLAFASETGADLIALGTTHTGRVEQWILGSVATDVIRDGRCSVLVLPAPQPLPPNG
jgi:nucleotide-binding universal stress UspA family protein